MIEKQHKIKRLPISRKVYIILVIIGGLTLLRMALPSIIKDKLNHYLANNVENYTGHIGDFDLSLWRGAYQVENFILYKKSITSKIPFLDIKEVDISLSWKALFRGHFLVDLELNCPKINFTDSKKKENKQFGIENKGQTWAELREKIVPFNLESLKTKKGEIHFHNEELKTPLDLALTEIELVARNIHNSKKEKEKLISDYEMTAKAQKSAEFYSKGSFNILDKPLAFDVNLKLEKLNLTELNGFFKAYGPLDVTSGSMNFYMEMASKDGKIKGYLKPMFKNMDVRAGSKEVDDSFKEFGFEIITAVINVILKNSENKSLSTKIPIEGSINSPDIGVWEGVKTAIANGFGKREVEPKIDNEIDLKSVPQGNKK